MKQKEKKENQVEEKQQEEKSSFDKWIEEFKVRWKRTFRPLTADVRRGEMTAEDAINNVFGGNFEDLVVRKIKEVEDTIDYKSKACRDFSAMFVIQTKRDEILYERVRDHFIEKGFDAYIDSFNKKPELQALIIMWYKVW